jgi:hypothetical protein
MRSIATLAFLLTISLNAQKALVRPAAERHDQTLENAKRFATTSLDRAENLSCSEAPSPGTTKTITVEFSSTASKGAASNIDTAGLVRDVFAPSSGTEFTFDHVGNVRGKAVAVYNYSFQMNGKTRSGSVFADEETGAITRMTFRGADAAAHLFCSARQ